MKISIVSPTFRKKHFPFLVTLLTLISVPIYGEAAGVQPTTVNKQIYEAVQKQMTTLIQSEANKRKWPKYTATYNIFMPPSATQLALCPAPLKTSTPGNGRANLSRLRVDVSCAGASGWEISVNAKPEIVIPLLMANTTLERGHVITEDDLAVKKYNIAGARSEMIWKKEDVVGMTVKRRLRALNPITQSMLESPILVERGQRIIMIASMDGATAQTTGLAMAKGRRGDVIKVKNESSGQQVSAQVTDFGVVTVVNSARK